MTSASSSRLALALTLLLSTLACIYCSEILRIEQPADISPWFGTFTGPLRVVNNTLPEKPSLFGFHDYHTKFTGRVNFSMTYTGMTDGCSAMPNLKPDIIVKNQSVPNPSLIIALMDRGNCSFAVKAGNAQAANADAFLVINSDDGLLPYMSGGNEGRSLSTPGMIVKHSHGQALKAMLASGKAVWMSMTWFVPNPDDRVEWDLYTFANDANSVTFKSLMGQVITSMGNRTLFTPHYAYMDGEWSGCTPLPGDPCTDENLICGNKCTNCGRYCAFDPENDPDHGSSGADIVQENIRQTCLWIYGNATDQPSLWWTYVNQRDASCGTVYSELCSFEVMGQLPVDINQAITLPDGTPNWSIHGCSAAMYGPNQDDTIDIVEDAMDWSAQFGAFPPPFLYVNEMPYFGGFECANPLNVNCGPLDMICQGFALGTAPLACSTDPGCPLGEKFDKCMICGGNNTVCLGCDGVLNSGRIHDACGNCLKPDDSKFQTDPDKCVASGVSVGTVIAIVVPIVVVVALGIYFYMKRQQTKVRDDIDSLLKQYLPLDGTQSISGNENGKRRGHAPLTSVNQRMIDTHSDEPTDL